MKTLRLILSFFLIASINSLTAQETLPDFRTATPEEILEFAKNIQSRTHSSEPSELITIDWRILATLDQEYQNGWVNTDSSYRTYYLEKERDSVTHFTWDSSHWEISTLELFETDSQALEWIIILKNFDGLEWTNNMKIVFSYDSIPGNFIQSVLQFWDSSGWENFSRYVYEYDSLDRRTSESLEYWDSAIWVPSTRTIYEYYKDKLKSLMLLQKWDINQSDWQNDQQTIYTYYPNNDLLQKTKFQLWNVIQWKDHSQTLYTYGSNDELIFVTKQYGHEFNWQNGFRDYYASYTSEGMPDTIIFQDWQSNHWEDASRNVIAYTSFGKEMTWQRQRWTGTEWQEELKYLYEYNEEELMTKGTSLKWNEDSLKLVYASRSFYFYEMYFIMANEPIEQSIIHSAYPNPFYDQLFIEFENPGFQQPLLEVFNSNGQKLAEIQGNQFSEKISWNGEDNKGNRLPSGLYIYKLFVGEKTASGKVVFMK